MSKSNEIEKQIASFILLTVAVSLPVAAEPERVQYSAPVERYAGPVSLSVYKIDDPIIKEPPGCVIPPISYSGKIEDVTSGSLSKSQQCKQNGKSCFSSYLENGFKLKY